MKVVNQISELRGEISRARQAGRSVGLVPTMGALHNGHLSLIEEAAHRNDFIVVSIFVNPTQFNDPSDLERYPRDLDADLQILGQQTADIVFAPDVKEMYPEKDKRNFDLSPLDKVMEGKFRPGHFKGVAQIVTKLFDAVTPDRAYFGQKDFQQLAIIRKIAGQSEQEIEIIGCLIIREPDGLAMSSRNVLLTPDQRKAAPLIYQTLVEAKKRQSSYSPVEITEWVTGTINAHPLMQVEYFEIVDEQELMPVTEWGLHVNKVGCIAVHLGRVRLIDNVYFD